MAVTCLQSESRVDWYESLIHVLGTVIHKWRRNKSYGASSKPNRDRKKEKAIANGDNCKLAGTSVDMNWDIKTAVGYSSMGDNAYIVSCKAF